MSHKDIQLCFNKDRLAERCDTCTQSCFSKTIESLSHEFTSHSGNDGHHMQQMTNKTDSKIVVKMKQMRFQCISFAEL